jgi:GcrA cell cycle regulator
MSANCATWTSERIELLKRCLHAGLSCGQIAREIGVTRNAVIGKMNRLGLSRPKDVIGRQLKQRSARLARPKTPRTWRPKRPRLNIFAQHGMLMAAFPRSQPPAEDIPIYNGRGCA